MATASVSRAPVRDHAGTSALCDPRPLHVRSTRRVKQLEAENRRLERRAAQLGRDDHRPPKKSCRDPGDPPETPRHRRDRLHARDSRPSRRKAKRRRCVRASASSRAVALSAALGPSPPATPRRPRVSRRRARWSLPNGGPFRDTLHRARHPQAEGRKTAGTGQEGVGSMTEAPRG